MAKVFKQNGGEPYFETLVAADVPSTMPTGLLDNTLRREASEWVATNYFKVAADGTMINSVATGATNPNLTINSRSSNGNFISCLRLPGGLNYFSVSNNGTITSDSLISGYTRVLVSSPTGQILSSTKQLPAVPEQHCFVSTSFGSDRSPYFTNLELAISSYSIIYLYDAGVTPSPLTVGFANKQIISGTPQAFFNGVNNVVNFGAFTYDNCVFDRICIGSVNGAVFNNCQFINCTNTTYNFGYNAVFTGTNTFNSPRLSLGGFTNNGVLKGTIKSCNQYFTNNGSLSLILESINLTTVSVYLGDNSKTEINGAKVFVSQVAAFQCGFNAMLILNNVRIKGTTDAWAVEGNTGVTLNANNCIFDCKTASGASVQYIMYGLWNGVTASGSVTATFSTTNALNANAANLYDTIQSF